MDEPRGALMLLFATPAVASMAYANITGTYDHFSLFCFYLSCIFYMMSGVLAYQGYFMQNKWDMTYWGLPFPLAAFNMGVHDYHMHVVISGTLSVRW